MRALLISLTLLTVSLPHTKAADGWVLSTSDDGAAYISYKPGPSVGDSRAPSVEGLLKLVDTLKGKGPVPLQHITFTNFFLADLNIQKELLAQFAEKHGDLLKAARASAGNMHDPKVLPLRAVFSKSLLRTPTIRKIDERLQAHGYRISGVSHEKFSLDKSTDPTSFRSFVWLIIKPKAQIKD